MQDGESPEEAARREAGEEIWPVPVYRVTGIQVQDCGGSWSTVSEIATLRLHPGFRRWAGEHMLHGGERISACGRLSYLTVVMTEVMGSAPTGR